MIIVKTQLALNTSELEHVKKLGEILCRLLMY